MFTLAVVVSAVAVVAVPEKVVAVIIPALKLPLASRATIALAVLRCVAFDVTVNVTAVPVAWFAVKVAMPDNPVPDVLRSNVPLPTVIALVVMPVMIPLLLTEIDGTAELEP